MRIHHLNCGTFCPAGRKLFNREGGMLERGRLVCHCFLLEGPTGLTLVDTGLGTHDVQHPNGHLPGVLWQALTKAALRMEETALHQVKALGFDPRDVRHIVLTHLDFDHAGGLADFPEAEIHVLDEEHEQALHPQKLMDRVRYSQDQFSHGPKWHLHSAGGDRWLGFESVKVLEDDVLLIPLRGHSRGHCGVAVRNGQGWILNCGDAAFDRGEVSGAERQCPPGLRAYQNVFQFDRKARMQNQNRLRELAVMQRGKVQIITSHDPFQFDQAVAHELPLNKRASLM
jgi:glyoxylase-like metal-dependent hydrolase (beta-lactamase superfamily II)